MEGMKWNRFVFLEAVVRLVLFYLTGKMVVFLLTFGGMDSIIWVEIHFEIGGIHVKR